MYCTKVDQNYCQVLSSNNFQDTISFLKTREEWAEAIKCHKNTYLVWLFSGHKAHVAYFTHCQISMVQMRIKLSQWRQKQSSALPVMKIKSHSNYFQRYGTIYHFSLALLIMIIARFVYGQEVCFTYYCGNIECPILHIHFTFSSCTAWSLCIYLTCPFKWLYSCTILIKEHFIFTLCRHK